MPRSLFICILSFISTGLFAQDFALEQLNESPRHHEWVSLSVGERQLHGFLAFPEKSTPTTTVIVIHENRGLTDWVRAFADQLAAEGYLAIAPDLLSEFDNEYKKTSDFASSDDARTALYQLPPDRITTDLSALEQYIGTIASANGKVIVMGFCWGGSQTFRHATNSAAIDAAMVFYGSPPKNADAFEKINVPVYGFYGENDQRINATIEDTRAIMANLKKHYDPVIYPDAGHAFMRRGDDPNGDAANRRARDAAWLRIKELLSKI